MDSITLFNILDEALKKAKIDFAITMLTPSEYSIDDKTFVYQIRIK